MSAYAIARIKAKNWQWHRAYGEPVAALIRKHGGRYLARGNSMDRLEGHGELPDAIVVLEFPSVAQARAWYDDPEYARWIAHRRPHTDVDFVVVDGLPPEQEATPNDPHQGE